MSRTLCYIVEDANNELTSIARSFVLRIYRNIQRISVQIEKDKYWTVTFNYQQNKKLNDLNLWGSLRFKWLFNRKVMCFFN